MDIKIHNSKSNNTIFNTKNWIEYTSEIKLILEKQIPMKGIPYNSAKNHNFVECSVCNKDMGMYYKYCPHCGQKINWS